MNSGISVFENSINVKLNSGISVFENSIISVLFKYLQTPNVLRKLKYKLSRKNLEKLYLVYIRPIFEYACEVWDNCGVGNSNKLDYLQLAAARNK
jgi:hypothetical protein